MSNGFNASGAERKYRMVRSCSGNRHRRHCKPVYGKDGSVRGIRGGSRQLGAGRVRCTRRFYFFRLVSGEKHSDADGSRHSIVAAETGPNRADRRRRIGMNQPGWICLSDECRNWIVSIRESLKALQSAQFINEDFFTSGKAAQRVAARRTWTYAAAENLRRTPHSGKRPFRDGD